MNRPSSGRRVQLAVYASQMRLGPTVSEARLWAALRGGRLGVSFRRQAVIGEFIVDFVAPAVKLVVEVDGGYHAGRARADARRGRWLERAGYRVLRIEAGLVMSDLARAVRLIVERLG